MNARVAKAEEQYAEDLRRACADIVERHGQPLAVDSIAVLLAYPEEGSSRVIYSWRANADQQARNLEQAATSPTASLKDPATMSLALQGSERVLGSVLFHRSNPKSYTEQERQQALLLTRQIAGSMDNLLRNWNARDTETESDPVEEVVRALLSGSDAEQSYQEFAQILGRLVEFDWASIIVIDQRHGLISIRHLVGTELPGRLINTVRPLAGSQTKEVLDSGKTLVRADVAKEIRFSADSAFIKSGLRSAIMVPIGSGGQVIGVLSLRSRGVGVYSHQARILLEKLARRIALYIEDSQLFQELQINVKELALVKEVAPVLASTLNLEEVFDALSQAANRVIRFNKAALYWISTNGHDINVLEDMPEGQLKLPPGAVGKESEISTWLTYQQELIGQLVLTRSASAFYWQDQQLLNRLGVQIAPALQNTRIYQQTERQFQEFQPISEEDSDGTALQHWSSLLDQIPLVDLAHRIRTPLTAIKGYTTTLLQPDLTWTQEEQTQFLKTIDQEVDRLNEAIGNLIGLGTEGVTLPATEPVETSAADLLAQVIEELGKSLPGRSVETKIESGLPSVVVDPLKIRKVVTELARCLDAAIPNAASLVLTAQLASGQPMLSLGSNLDNVMGGAGDLQPPVANEIRLLVCRRLLEAQGLELFESEGSSGPAGYFFPLHPGSALDQPSR
ncbi:MAG: GAF domain-containing protein [Dehalococcoidia bacterium]